MRAFDRGVTVRIPAHRYLPDDPPAFGPVGGLPGNMPGVHQVFVGLHGHQMVGEFGEFLDTLRPAHRHAQADRNIGYVPQSCGVHLEVVATPVHQPAAEQFANDLDGFAQHVLAPFDGGPVLADDVFVEVFTAAQPEREPSVGKNLHGGGLLGDDRGVVAHRRARDIGV